MHIILYMIWFKNDVLILIFRLILILVANRRFYSLLIRCTPARFLGIHTRIPVGQNGIVAHSACIYFSSSASIAAAEEVPMRCTPSFT